MLIVRKVYPDDFERVYDLLKDYWSSEQVSKQTWKQLFINNWDTPEDYFGYLILDQDKVVGYVATIFSKRIINGQEHKFCSLSSWVVRKDYREHKMLLQDAILELDDYTITIFSATKRTSQLNKGIGYGLLDNYQKLVFPVPTSKSWFLDKAFDFRVLYDHEEIASRLNHNELIIFNDHKNYNCTHILISTTKGNCHAILKSSAIYFRGIKLPFMRIDYLSNRDIFCEFFDSIKLNLCWNLKLVGLMIFERFLPKQELPYSITRPMHSTLYKSKLLEPKDIDNLYSEYYLLDM
jgi:hypothetical protein